MVRTSDGRDGVLSLDEIFDVLVSPRRRTVLYLLHKRSPMDVDDLGRAVATAETAATDVTAVDRRKRIGVALEHTHLPKLEQVGLVSYDRAAGTVELDSVSPQFERYLQYAAEDEELSRRDDVDDTNDTNDVSV